MMRTLVLLGWLGGTVLLHAAEEPAFVPTRVAFAPDGKSLAVGGRVGKGFEVRLLEVATRKPLWREPFAANVTGLAWTAEGQTVFVAAGPMVSQLDARTGKVLRQLGPHGNRILALALSSDGKLLATGGEDRIARLWKVANGTQSREFTGHKGAVSSVAISPDGKKLATSGGTEVCLWDIESGNQVRNLSTGSWQASDVLFADAGRTLLLGGSEGRVRLRDSTTGETRGDLAGLGGVFALRYHESSHTLVWASWSQVGIFEVNGFPPDAATKKKIRALMQAMDDDRYEVRESASKQMLALGWIATAELRRAVKESPSTEVRIRARAILADSSETPRHILRGHRGNVRDASIRPDGKLLATTADDGTLRLWDVVTGKQTAILVGGEVAGK